MTVTEAVLTCLLDSAVSGSIYGSVVSRLPLTDESLGRRQGFVNTTTSTGIMSYEVLTGLLILRSILDSFFSRNVVAVRLMN